MTGAGSGVRAHTLCKIVRRSHWVLAVPYHMANHVRHRKMIDDAGQTRQKQIFLCHCKISKVGRDKKKLGTHFMGEGTPSRDQKIETRKNTFWSPLGITTIDWSGRQCGSDTCFRVLIFGVPQGGPRTGFPPGDHPYGAQTPRRPRMRRPQRLPRHRSPGTPPGSLP